VSGSGCHACHGCPMDPLREMIRAEVRQALGPIVEDLRELVREAREGGPASTEPYLTAKQAGEIAGVTEGTIRHWVREGRLTPRWAGRKLRIDRTDLESFCRRPPRDDDDGVAELADRIMGSARSRSRE
jgi:excisionase family DNA binding protein